MVPRITAPACRRRATTVASLAGILPRFTRLPISQRWPAVEMEDFTVTGRPASGPSETDALSIARARSRTRSGSKSTRALIWGFSRSIWRMYSSASSRDEISLARSRASRSVAERWVNAPEVRRGIAFRLIFTRLP